MSEPIEPVKYVIFGYDAEGNFIMDIHPDDEMEARAMAHKGSEMLGAYYVQKQANKVLLEKAQQRIIDPRNGGVN